MYMNNVIILILAVRIREVRISEDTLYSFVKVIVEVKAAKERIEIRTNLYFLLCDFGKQQPLIDQWTPFPGDLQN